MRRSFVSRVVALTIASLVGISSPGLALAHGHAHHEAGDHAALEREDHRSSGAAETQAGRGEWTMAIEPAKDSTAHVHPQLVNALSARMHASLFVLPPRSVAVQVGVVFTDTASLVLSAASARAAPAGAPLRQPRAPPLG